MFAKGVLQAVAMAKSTPAKNAMMATLSRTRAVMVVTMPATFAMRTRARRRTQTRHRLVVSIAQVGARSLPMTITIIFIAKQIPRLPKHQRTLHAMRWARAGIWLAL